MKRIFLFLFLLLVFLGNINTVSAETYTYTFTKEDKTYIVTKTIEEGKITIEGAEPTPAKELLYPTKTVTKTLEKISPVPTKALLEVPPPIIKTYLQSDFPLEVSKETGNLLVKSSSGDKELLNDPEIVVKKAEDLGLDLIAEVKLIEDSSGIKYLVSGTKKEKLLALFEVYLPTSFVFNPDNGKLEKIEQTSLIKITDLLSF